MSLLIGLLGFVQISVVGEMLAGDLFFFFIFVYLLATRGVDLLETRCAVILIFATVWLSSQVATDLVRDADAHDFLRGWAKIVVFSINFAAAYMFLRTDRRVSLFVLGYCVSSIPLSFLQPVENAHDDPWKWVFGWPITFLLVLLTGLAYKRGNVAGALGILCFACLLNLYFNFRSMALFCFGTGCCLLLSHRRNSRPNYLALTFVAIALAVCAWIFSGLYGYVAENGYLGPRAQTKYKLQSSGDMGMLLGGRNESFASIQAIVDSPVLGHGSWAREPQYAELMKSAQAAHGYRPAYLRTDLIPSHSHIIGAWVDAGILGALFWAIVLFVALKGFIALLSNRCSIKPLSLFCGIVLLWDILFSPFAGTRTVLTPIFVILMIRAAKLPSRREAGI